MGLDAVLVRLLLGAALLPGICTDSVAADGQASVAPAVGTPFDHDRALAALAAQASDERVPALSVVSQLSNCQATTPESLAILAVLLERHADSAKQYALLALVRFGHAGVGLAPQVLALTAPGHGSACRAQALAALAALQPTEASVAPVLACLDDPRLGRSAHLSAAQLLGGWSAAARGALPALDAHADDPDALVAEAALRAVAAIAAPMPADGLPHPGVPAPQLDSELRLLLRQQPPSDAAITALIAVAELDARHGARTWAWRTLGELGLMTPAAIGAMQRLAGGTDPALARLAASALAGEAPSFPGPGAGAAVVAALAQGLDQDPPVQAASARGLRHLGPTAVSAAPRMIDAILADEAMPTARLAVLCEALRACGALPPAECARLASLLPDDAGIYAGRNHLQAEIVQTLLLATMSATGVPTVAHRAVLAVLANPDPTLPALTAAAARASGACRVEGRFAVPALVALLGDAEHDAAVDLFALERLTFERHGPPPPPRDGADSVRIEALKALLAIGPAAGAAEAAVRALAGQPGTTGDGLQLHQLANAVLAGLEHPSRR